LPSVTFVAGSTAVLNANTLTVDLTGGGTFTFDDFVLGAGASPDFIVTAHAVQDAAVETVWRHLATRAAMLPLPHCPQLTMLICKCSPGIEFCGRLRRSGNTTCSPCRQAPPGCAYGRAPRRPL
jgi:hypothetical protein